MSIERALILAAGFGKRLQPLTNITPKPLLKINNITLLENTIIFLKKFGIKSFAINAHYLSDQIVKFSEEFKNKYDLTIFKEKEILGTGGGIRNSLLFFQNKNFIVINSDTVWTEEYLSALKDLNNKFDHHKALVGLLMVNKKNSYDPELVGDFSMKEDPYLFRERKEDNKLIYTGCQILNPKMINNKDNKNFSVHEIWDEAIDKNKMIGTVSDNIFYHATNLEIYKKLEKIDIID